MKISRKAYQTLLGLSFIAVFVALVGIPTATKPIDSAGQYPTDNAPYSSIPRFSLSILEEGTIDIEGLPLDYAASPEKQQAARDILSTVVPDTITYRSEDSALLELDIPYFGGIWVD